MKQSWNPDAPATVQYHAGPKHNARVLVNGKKYVGERPNHIAISACNFRSSSSSSSSSACTGALPLTEMYVSDINIEMSTVELTLAVRCRWQSVYLIRHRHSAGLEHLVVQLLLFQLGQLVIQLGLVDWFADGSARDSSSDFLSQGMLLTKLVPKYLISVLLRYSRSEDGTYITSSTLSMLSLP